MGWGKGEVLVLVGRDRVGVEMQNTGCRGAHLWAGVGPQSMQRSPGAVSALCPHVFTIINEQRNGMDQQNDRQLELRCEALTLLASLDGSCFGSMWLPNPADLPRLTAMLIAPATLSLGYGCDFFCDFQ